MNKRFRKLTTIAVFFLIVAMMLPGCTSKSSGQSYKAGTYSAKAAGHGGDVNVDVTFTDSKIDTIVVGNEAETEGLGKPALTKVADEIVENQSLAVDTVAGATESSNAMITAVAAAVDLAGGDSKALLNKEVEVVKGEDETISTDVVVVGAGASGTAAALAAAEKGAKVVILEKGDAPGGAGRFLAEGLLAFESDQQKAAGETYTVEDGMNYLLDYTHYLSNGNLTRAILQQSASTIDWLASYGTETKLMENTQKAHINDPITYHKYVDKHKSFDTMYAKLEEMGATLYTKTAGKELIKDEDGNITGVIADQADGSKLTVNAKKVILATGGYAGNAEMVKEALNITDFTTMAWANTGDGLTMGLSAGAGVSKVDTVAVHSALVDSENPKIWQGTASNLLQLPLMWINREGKRFVDEGVVYDFALWGNSAVSQGGLYYIVVDDATMKTLIEKGSDLTTSFEKTYMVAFGLDTTKSSNITAPMPNLYESMDETITAGAAFKGDTIEALAEAMGVDATNLKNAAATYSKDVIDGKDTQFMKNSEYLKYTVEKGPFYAVKAAALVENSDGGLRVNDSLQVLTPELKTINNLYAVGCDAGGIVGDSYPTFEGLTLSFAMNSGRIAGYSAAENLK